jgi:hypothetical protein
MKKGEAGLFGWVASQVVLTHVSGKRNKLYEQEIFVKTQPAGRAIKKGFIRERKKDKKGPEHLARSEKSGKK